MGVPVRELRGHHLVDLANFLYEAERVKGYYLMEGYGEEFVRTQTVFLRILLREE